MTQDQQMEEIRVITERWLRVLEKDINRLVTRGKPESIVHSAAMNAAARIAVSTVLANPSHRHTMMFRQFDTVVTSLYQEQVRLRGPQIIIPGSSIN